MDETLAGLNRCRPPAQPNNFSAMAAAMAAAMAGAQPRCSDTQAAKRSTSLQVVSQQVAGTSMWCDISTGKARLLVPA